MNISVALRVFTPSVDLLSKTFQQVKNMLDKLQQVKTTLWGLKFVDILIPVNPAFKDVDCGATKASLRETIGFVPFSLKITESAEDPFSGILNELVLGRVKKECTHLLVASLTCASYMTAENISRLVAPFDEGARATGLVLPDLKDLISAGNLTNTFAMWDIEMLIRAGMFDLRVGNPYKDQRRNTYVRAGLGGSKIYPITGVEVPTLVNLIDLCGPCIAPVLPVEEGVWEHPNPEIDQDGYLREVEKMASKKARHDAAAAMMGVTLEFVKSGVMPGYPK